MRLYQIFLFTILIFAAGSCANRAAGPTGGPKDSIPPVVVRSSPINGAVNFKKKDIQVYFNENITLDKVMRMWLFLRLKNPADSEGKCQGSFRIFTG